MSATDIMEMIKKGEFNLLLIKIDSLNSTEAIKVLTEISRNFFDNGELSKAIFYRKRCLKLAKEVNDYKLISHHLTAVGTIYTFKGEMDRALEYFEKSLELNKNPNNDQEKKNLSYSLIAIAYAYTLKGMPTQALEIINQSLNVCEDIKHDRGIARCLVIKGINHKTLGNLDVALNYLNEGIELAKNSLSGRAKHMWIPFALFQVILVTDDLHDIDKATQYLKEFEKFAQKIDNTYVRLSYRFGQAIVQKMSKRGKNKLLAQDKFKEIIDEEILYQDITVLAMFNLCELLLLEIKISSDADKELLLEIRNLSDKLLGIAHRQNSSWLLVLAFVLQSKLALIQEDLESAVDQLDNAEALAKEQNLGNLLSKVNEEQEVLHMEFEKWQELFRRNASLSERIELARFEKYLSEAKKLQESKMRQFTDSDKKKR